MFERACCSNSPSTSCNSGAISSKIRFAVSWTSSISTDCVVAVIYSRFTIYGLLIRSVVSELHVNSEVFRFEVRDHLLQRIAIAAGDAHHVTLNRGLHPDRKSVV